MTPIIEITNLTKQYKNSPANAVDGISFSVAPGQLFALLGPNGAGKTTTISILTTTLAPTSGQALIAGYDLATQSSEVRRHVGIIFQKPSLDLNLTAKENVRFNHHVIWAISLSLNVWHNTQKLTTTASMNCQKYWALKRIFSAR